MDKNLARAFGALLGLLVFFAALEEGAHDLWAATFVHLGALALAVAAFAHAAFSAKSKGLTAPLWPAAAVLAAVFGLSAAGAVNKGESIFAFKDWLACLAAFFAGAQAFREEEAVDVFLAFLPPVFLVEFAVSVAQRRFQGHFFMEAPPGTLGNANLTAAFLILWVPVFADKAMRKGPARWYWAAGAALDLGSLLLSFTMWGFFCLLLGLGLWLAARFGRRWLERHVRLAAAAALGAAILAGAASWWKLTRAANWEGHPIAAGTQTSRLLWWASAWRMFRDHPLLGVGLGNFPSAYRAYKVGAGQNTLFAHSLPLMILAETGTLGAAALLFFLGSWALRCRRAGARGPFLLGLAMFAAFGTISLSVEYLANLLAFFLFLAAAAAPCAKDWRKPSPLAAVVLGLCGLASAPFAAAPFFASRHWVDADAKLSRGEASSAAAEYASAAALDPLSFEAERGWARALALTGDFEQAAVHQSRAVALNRLDPTLRRELAEYEAASQRLRKTPILAQ